MTDDATNQEVVRASNNGDAFVFSLPAAMTIENAEAVASVFRDVPVISGMSLRLDASRVEVVTTPGLQLVLSLKKYMAARGCGVEISGESSAFSAAVSDLGMRALLG